MVKIHSEIAIMVYPTISYTEQESLVNPAMGIKGRSVAQNWSGKGTLIRKGKHSYDDSLAKHPTIQDFVKRGLMTIEGATALDEPTKPATRGSKKGNTLADLADVEE